MEYHRTHPEIRVTSLKGREVYFTLLRGQLEVDAIHPVDITIHTHLGQASVLVRERYSSERYRGELAADEPLRPEIKRALAREERRHLLRQKCRIPVHSASLPQNRADAVDISRSGVRVRAADAVEAGRVMPLEFKLEQQRQQLMRAEVRWCRPLADGYEFGARFVELDKRQRAFLGRLESYWADRDSFEGAGRN